MRLCSTAPVHASDTERRTLEALVHKRHTPQGLVMRAQSVLLAARGLGVRPTAVRLGVGRSTVQRWRRRWSSSPATSSVLERLVDAPRPGTPATFTPEQICAIPTTASSFTSRPSKPRGSIRSRCGARSWRAKSSAAAASPRSRTCVRRSPPSLISSTTPWPNRFDGPLPANHWPHDLQAGIGFFTGLH